MKLQKAGEAVNVENGWLSLDELKKLMEYVEYAEITN